MCCWSCQKACLKTVQFDEHKQGMKQIQNRREGSPGDRARTDRNMLHTTSEIFNRFVVLSIACNHRSCILSKLHCSQYYILILYRVSCR